MGRVPTVRPATMRDSSAAIASARLSGFHAAFLTASILVFLAAMSALLIRDEDAAASMGHGEPVSELAPEAA